MLADKLLEITQSASAAEWARLLGRDLEAARFFEASEVAEYFWAGNDREEWEDPAFPNIAPPFPTIWIEYAPPTRIVSAAFGELGEEPWPDDLKRQGALIISHENTERSSVQIIRDLMVSITEKKTGKTPKQSGELPAELAMSEIPKWICSFALVADSKSRGPVLDPTSFVVPLRADGSIMSGAKFAFSKAPDHVANWISVRPFMMALQFVNAVNVKTEEVESSSSQQRRRIKRGKLPFVRHSIIRVPGYSASDRSDASTAKPESRALHLVRGHFKRRATGVFWWHPHLRGSAQDGVVVSKYEVVPRKDD